MSRILSDKTKSSLGAICDRAIIGATEPRDIKYLLKLILVLEDQLVAVHDELQLYTERIDSDPFNEYPGLRPRKTNI